MSLKYTDREEKIINYDLGFLGQDIIETKHRIESAMSRMIYLEKRYNNLILTMQHREGEHEDVTNLDRVLSKAANE